MPGTAAKLRAKLYCHACGRRIHPSSRFCRHCGGGVSGDSASGATFAVSPRQTLLDSVPEADGDMHHDPTKEQPVWQGRPAWRAFSAAWAAWFVICGVLLYAASKFGGGPLVQAVWVFVAGSATGLFARNLVIVYGRRYHLTTQRLFLHRGILTRVSDQMELIRVDDVRVSQTILDRLLDTGNIEIFSSDETDETIALRSILDPSWVAEEIRRHTRGVRVKGAIAVERL